MKSKPIIIVAGNKNTIFFEIFFKCLKLKKYKSPLILIGDLNILKEKMNRYKFQKKIRLLNINDLGKSNINNNNLNLINVSYNKISKKSENTKSYLYVKNSFELAFKILKFGYSKKFINGPINKDVFLKKKYLGITEYISTKFKKKKIAMLIYNKDLSVCPITTHLPLKIVSNEISRKLIIEKTILIDNFFKKNFNKKPKIGVTGLNPHCESILEANEDKKIILPTINFLKKKGYKIDGPFAADTIFLKQNRVKYDVILGMYHDQVLGPIKTLKEYDAINITLGLPFFRVSPDHGTNEKMVDKNLSNPLSLIRALEFLDKR